MKIRLTFVFVVALAFGPKVLADASSAAAQRFVADDVIVFESDINVWCAFGFPTPAGLTPVSWSTADGTAVAGSDYKPASGNVDVGRIAQAHVEGIRDNTPELPEYFYIDFYVGGAVQAHYRATVTILDDQGPEMPQLSIEDTEVAEGPAGTNTTARVHVHLSEAPTTAIDTAYLSGNGTATRGVDFEPLNQSVTFLPGQRDAELEMMIHGDDQLEGDENLSVCLVSVSKGVFLPEGRNGPQICGTVTIRDHEPPTLPILTLSDATVRESSGPGSVADFELTLDFPASQPVVVHCVTRDIGTAEEGHDNDAFDGTVTFSPGETRKVISLSVHPDLSSEEPDEWFLLFIWDFPTDLVTVRRSRGRATIVNRELPAIYAEDIKVPEPRTQFVDVPFTLRLATPAAAPVFVAYYVLDGTAKAFFDYCPRYGIATFAKNEVSTTIPIRVFADDDIEESESFEAYWFVLGPFDSVHESRVTIGKSDPGRIRAVGH